MIGAMARPRPTPRGTLSAAQRAALPRSAFAHPSTRSYPVPTKAQARKAGIGEPQRQRMLRSAASLSARRDTKGSGARIGAKAKTRSGPGAGWSGSHHARRR
jgi:hypothetical protein